MMEKDYLGEIHRIREELTGEFNELKKEDISSYLNKTSEKIKREENIILQKKITEHSETK